MEVHQLHYTTDAVVLEDSPNSLSLGKRVRLVTASIGSRPRHHIFVAQMGLPRSSKLLTECLSSAPERGEVLPQSLKLRPLTTLAGPASPKILLGIWMLR